MCGIIACRTERPALDYLRVALRRLEYRGYDSVGIALQTSTGDVVRLRTVGRMGALDKLVGDWSGPQFDGVGIGHTRWATHGAVTEGNAHPHRDCTGAISLVHNGIIENADALTEELITAGHVFDSSVDSEVLCHLIEDQRKRCGDLFEAVQNALSLVKGSWALAALEQGTGCLVVAAHKSPLLIANTSHGDFAASDFAAVADWADDFRVLEDGDVVELGGTGRWSHRGGDTSPRAITHCDWNIRDADLNGYTDYMAKEIDEQPEAVSRVLDELGAGIPTGAIWTGLGMAPFERLLVIGCGTSLNAGHVIGNVVSRLGHIPVTCIVGSEAAQIVPESATLCLAISQSGETADVLSALEAPALAGFPILALTNNLHSTLARRADAVMNCAAGLEIGVAATKSFVCQIVAGSAAMISALVAMGLLDKKSAAHQAERLCELPNQLATARDITSCVLPPLVEKLTTAGGFIFIARGSGLPYAAEGALKLKELTYRWAEHYPAGELKHGPLALISPGIPVIVVDNADPKLGANVAEVQARGGHVISIGSAGSTVPVVETPHAPWGPLAATVPLQILARTLALALGRDVDKPRNLAKSVTVE
jgi:glucosamine--fructose-6-phosphate aminotransferase (isomerizing)